MRMISGCQVFGASDPNAGTATLHEIMRGLGELVKKGWKPLRTILIANWDAEEVTRLSFNAIKEEDWLTSLLLQYGLIGSTEFGEDYADWLQDNSGASPLAQEGTHAI